nr:hypothetical protein [Tanacetum cinerariifolium]
MILSGADNRPPMLDKDLYDSWKIKMALYMQNREYERIILESVENDPLILPTIEENRVTRTKKYVELSVAEKIQADCDMKKPSHHSRLKGHSATSLGETRSSYSGTKSNATSSRENNASGQARVVKCYNCQGKGHMARQCTQPKRLRNAAWYKYKAMLAEAQKAGQILDEEQLAFLADPGVLDGQAVQKIIPNNDAFQTGDLDTYDSHCDDVLNEKVVLMANISNYGSDVISEVPHSETCLNDIENQSVHAMQDFKQIHVMDFTDNEIHSDSNIIMYSQYLQETQLTTVQDTTLQSQQDLMILSVIEQMSEQMINHVNN